MNKAFFTTIPLTLFALSSLATSVTPATSLNKVLTCDVKELPDDLKGSIPSFTKVVVKPISGSSNVTVDLYVEKEKEGADFVVDPDPRKSRKGGRMLYINKSMKVELSISGTLEEITITSIPVSIERFLVEGINCKSE